MRKNIPNFGRKAEAHDVAKRVEEYCKENNIPIPSGKNDYANIVAKIYDIPVY